MWVDAVAACHKYQMLQLHLILVTHSHINMLGVSGGDQSRGDQSSVIRERKRKLR